MNKQITYLMSGPAHLPYLVCSLYTLRQSGYDGKVQVYAWPESFAIVSQIAQDKTLGIEPILHSPELRREDGIGGNAQFLDKIKLTQKLDCQVSLYLDADTTIHGSLDPLFRCAVTSKSGFCGTQFNSWCTNGGIIRKRLLELRDMEGIPQNLVNILTTSPWPSVNGGVWASIPYSSVLATWYDWTILCKSLFIADERVLHLMMVHKSISVLTEKGKYNCSHKHRDKELDPKDVVVWHYHGDSNVRSAKSPMAFEFWMKLYEHCLNENVGHMREWRPLIRNKYLGTAEKEWFSDERIF